MPLREISYWMLLSGLVRSYHRCADVRSRGICLLTKPRRRRNNQPTRLRARQKAPSSKVREEPSIYFTGVSARERARQFRVHVGSTMTVRNLSPCRRPGDVLIESVP